MCRINQHNSVQVVGHDDPSVKINFLPNGAGLQPFFCRDLAALIQLHCPVDDLTRSALALKGAKGNEIGTDG